MQMQCDVCDSWVPETVYYLGGTSCKLCWKEFQYYRQAQNRRRYNVSMPREIEKGKRPGAPIGGKKGGK